MNNLFLKEIKAIIFDVDNTLIASNQFVLENIKETINRLKEVKSIEVQMPMDDEINSVLAKNLPFEEIFQTLFIGEVNNRKLWEIVLEDYRAHAVNKPYLATKGATEAVKSLKKLGFVVGLVTNRVRMLDERLKQAGFDILDFEFMCMPPSKEFAKPHPRAFEEALKQLSVKGIRAEETIMFGDHLDDYYSAFYQNIKFIAVLQGYTSRAEFLNVGIEDQLILNDLQDIEDVLKKKLEIDVYKYSLQNVSAIDGRHAAMSFCLRHYFSEYALHKYRVKAEIEHLITLSEFFNGRVIRVLTKEEKQTLRNLYLNFSWHEGYQVLQYDHLSRNGVGPTEHDVKSCELWIREKLSGGLEDLKPNIHMFVTSEDINNLAYKSMLGDTLKEVFTPKISDIADQLKDLTLKYINDPIMARTHMQPASPTTFGKIFGNYLSRLTDGLNRLNKIEFKGKVNGAVGNYNAFIAAYPDLDWVNYSKELTKRLGFGVDLWTDQRGPHTDMIQAFQAVQEVGNVIRDLVTDLSLYASLGTMYFVKIESHVGSSVMPHKINPWFAEVAEGNVKKANYLINCFSNELDVSRLQRDLSDHDYERSYGEALGYILIAIEHLKIALGLIRPDTVYAMEELQHNPQIVAEAIQTILRKYGEEEAYNLLKNAFRGARPTMETMQSFVDDLKVSAEIKKEIQNILDPKKYTGLAANLAEMAVEKYEMLEKFITP